MTMTLLVFAILMRLAMAGRVPAGIRYDAISAFGFSETRNEIEVTSAKDGVFLRDGANDAPYSQQQRDRLVLRRQELESKLLEERGQSTEITAQLAEEREQINTAIRRLRAEGLEVHAMARDPDRLAALAKATGCIPHALDVRATDEIAKIAADIEVDILVNNAGQSRQGDVLSNSADDVDQLIDINLRAVLHLTRLFVPGMVKRDIVVDLPRPRDPASPEFNALKRELDQLVMEEQQRHHHDELRMAAVD